MKNKIAHTLVLAVFVIGCKFLSDILSLATRIVHDGAHGGALPEFTTFCISLRPVLIVLSVLAAAYCLWIWFRKIEALPSWIVFFAATMSVLVLITLPTLIAAYLPLINMVNYLARR